MYPSIWSEALSLFTQVIVAHASLYATTLWTWDLVNYSWPNHALSALVDQNGNQIANLAPRLNSRHRCKDVTQEGQKAAKFQGFKKQVFVLAMSIRDTYVDEYAS